jgi:hypothetical protein
VGKSLSRASSETDSSPSQAAIDSLWDAVSELKPDIVGETIETIISNAPLPIPINPAGIALSVKQLHDAYEFSKRYEWLLFLHTLRGKTKTAKS